MPQAMTGVLAMPDDDILLQQARSGDLPAREELFRRHFGVAYRVAYRHLGHDQDAQDAVQDSFLKAFLHLGAFDGRSGFLTWLLRIVTNSALDVGRKRRRRPVLHLEDGADSDYGAVVHHDPTVELRRADLRKILDRAIGQLSPTLRAPFILFAEAELSYKDIAEALEIPVGTVMSRLHDARGKLRLFLEGADL